MIAEFYHLTDSLSHRLLVFSHQCSKNDKGIYFMYVKYNATRQWQGKYKHVWSLGWMLLPGFNFALTSSRHATLLIFPVGLSTAWFPYLSHPVYWTKIFLWWESEPVYPTPIPSSFYSHPIVNILAPTFRETGRNCYLNLELNKFFSWLSKYIT